MSEEQVKCIRCGLTCSISTSEICIHHGNAQIACHQRASILFNEIDRLKQQNEKMRKGLKCMRELTNAYSRHIVEPFLVDLFMKVTEEALKGE